jgi:hypothetical protein
MAQLENGSSKVAKGQDDLKNPGIDRLHKIRGNYAGLPLLDSSLPQAAQEKKTLIVTKACDITFIQIRVIKLEFIN